MINNRKIFFKCTSVIKVEYVAMMANDSTKSFRLLERPASNVTQLTIGVYLKPDNFLVIVLPYLVHKQLKILS